MVPPTKRIPVNPVSQVQKDAHVASEKKRRYNIAAAMDDLRKIVPLAAKEGTPDSKATLIRKTVCYIAHLQLEIAALRGVPADQSFELTFPSRYVTAGRFLSGPEAQAEQIGHSTPICPTCHQMVDFAPLPTEIANRKSVELPRASGWNGCGCLAQGDEQHRCEAVWKTAALIGLDEEAERSPAPSANGKKRKSANEDEPAHRPGHAPRPLNHHDLTAPLQFTIHPPSPRHDRNQHEPWSYPYPWPFPAEADRPVARSPPPGEPRREDPRAGPPPGARHPSSTSRHQREPSYHHSPPQYGNLWPAHPGPSQHQFGPPSSSGFGYPLSNRMVYEDPVAPPRRAPYFEPLSPSPPIDGPPSWPGRQYHSSQQQHDYPGWRAGSPSTGSGPPSRRATTPGDGGLARSSPASLARFSTNGPPPRHVQQHSGHGHHHGHPSMHHGGGHGSFERHQGSRSPFQESAFPMSSARDGATLQELDPDETMLEGNAGHGKSPGEEERGRRSASPGESESFQAEGNIEWGGNEEKGQEEDTEIDELEEEDGAGAEKNGGAEEGRKAPSLASLLN